MTALRSIVGGLRAVVAASLVVGHSWLRPTFSFDDLRWLLEHQPELVVATLVLESFPAVVGAAWLVRALRPDSFSWEGPFAAAGRWAVLLAMAGAVFLPLHAADPESALVELGLRAAAFIGLAFLFDGPLQPAE
jgi:hypothetical protein